MCECNNNCADCEKKTDVINPERRKFLGRAVALINAAVGIAVVGPVIGFVAAPLFRKSQGVWVPVFDDAALALNETKEAIFAMVVKDGYQTVHHEYTVYLRRVSDRVVAFDPSCTHLGCRIKYQGDKGRYFCPCHGGVFDQDGKVVSGPPPKPLTEYPTKVEGGKILIYREV